MSPATDPGELLPVVDGQDRQVGLAPRGRIHAQNLRHRAVHVLLFTSDGRLWLQRRSASKDTYPEMWTSSASGHVDPGESYGQAAARELGEELGLELELEHLGKVAACAATANEFTGVYRALSDARPVPDPEEISRMGLFSLDEARALAADHSRAAPSLQAVMALLK
ncbi:MAG: NUDIX domain-containing protein [Desulfarculaceae bacterium]|nr:NUDIX domain-containing protein [Desulfarculaceae bacterium]MCF8073797.1 NUDIX domain-containing protein [Desulfarculaceae bacterium]MCF8102038.1 NUDIX domain-containing protein [Desulfarculaceae bacterium]MCF8116008.1 NUDIX domain-containing protein [Desulfarculaceae bacterium]